MTTTASFWDRVAEKYAARPVKDQAAYEQTLTRVRAHLQPTDRVLEIGCGTGSTALTLADEVAEMHATDISAKMIEIARAKPQQAPVTFRQGLIEDETGPYDVVMAFNLLHLLEDPLEAVRMAHALLPPGGRFITKTVCLGDKGVWLRLMIGAMRAVGYAPYVAYLKAVELEEIIRDPGFDIVETGTFPASPPSRFIVARKA